MQLAAAQLTAHLHKGLRSLYTLHGDEPLLVQEAADAIRAAARAQGYTERTVHTVAGAHFDWSEVLAAGGSLSLFADRQIVEIRIPSGKPGKDGSPRCSSWPQAAAGQRHHADAGAAAAAGQDDQERRLVRRARQLRRHACRSIRWSARRCRNGSPSAWRSRASAWWPARKASARCSSSPTGSRATCSPRTRRSRSSRCCIRPANCSFEQVESAVLNVARYDVFKLSEAVLAGQVARVQRMLDGLQAEGEAEVLVHYTLAEDIRALKRVKDAMGAGRPLPMALREQRVWGLKERLFERVLPRLSATALDNLLHAAHVVDGIVKGLKAPDWPTDGWQALHRLAMQLCLRMRARSRPHSAAWDNGRMNALNVAEYMQTPRAAGPAGLARACRRPARRRRTRRCAALADAAARQRARRCRPTTPRTSSAPRPPAWPRRWSTASSSRPKILETLAEGCEQLAAMPDIIGEIIGMKQQPSGIRVGQMRVPIGVFGMIFESRPNVTIEAASLSIKSGNACILRGGSEAIESNKALARLVREALAEAGLPADAVQLVQTTDREAVGQLIAMPQFVDVIIPRGGKGLIERISREAKVPVIKHLDGNCHVYVDDPCDIDMAVKVADNAKTQKYSPCNASRGPAGGARRGGAVPAADRRRVSRPRAWRCAATRAPRRSWPTWPARSCRTPPSRTGPRNTSRPSSASRWWPAWTRPSPTSTAIPATTPTPSSRATTCMRSASCARWIRPA